PFSRLDHSPDQTQLRALVLESRQYHQVRKCQGAKEQQRNGRREVTSASADERRSCRLPRPMGVHVYHAGTSGAPWVFLCCTQMNETQTENIANRKNSLG